VVVVVGVVDPPAPVCEEEPLEWLCDLERPDLVGDDEPLLWLCEDDDAPGLDEDPLLLLLELEDPPVFALDEPLPLPDGVEEPDDGADAPPELLAEWCDRLPACLPCASRRPCELVVLGDAPAVVSEVASAPRVEPLVVPAVLLLPHAVNPAEASRPVTSAVAGLA
jgi:hypothetical protein